MKNATAVARAVARDAEARAKMVLTEVMAAQVSFREAEAAITAATAARAAAHPALARAIDTALAAAVRSAVSRLPPTSAETLPVSASNNTTVD